MTDYPAFKPVPFGPLPQPEPEGLTDPPADRFRVGDVWRSPRGKDWRVELIIGQKVRLRALHNRHTTQWRTLWATGRDMLTAWERIHSGSQELTP